MPEEFEAEVTKQGRKRIINVPTKKFKEFPIHTKTKITKIKKT